jgi:UDP-GlcNAc:undecaprenyl-phosphate GlcNAc-1-phosphate transferase
MIERIRQGTPPFKADSNQFHHKLLGLGLRHAEAVLVIYLLHGLLTVAAWRLRYHSDWLLLCGYLLFALLSLGFLAFAGGGGWTLQRATDPAGGLLRLGRHWRTSAMAIRLSHGGLGWLLAALTAAHLALPAVLPPWVGWLALFFILALAVATFLPAGAREVMLRIPLYALAPYLTYLLHGQVGAAAGLVPRMASTAFFLVGLLAVLVVRLTRSKRFQPTPLDFLVLVIALVVPLFPVFPVDRTILAMVAIKVVVLFFGFEVYLVEKRGQLLRLNTLTFVALTTLAIRAFHPTVF